MPGFDAHGSGTAGGDTTFSSVPVAPGRMLGARYELIRPIARGGMAEVWEGLDSTLRRAVAVKILQTHLAGDVTFVERFRREAVTAARVAHPCVVATYDAGVDAGTAYIVMELVEGQTLRQLLTASAPLAPGLAVAIAQQIADALATAHRAGLVHRDIKPANILLCDDGAGALRVKVTDFGIAKVGAELGADLTQIGTVLGTPKYLSPEQVEGRVEPDARSDLYALGIVLYEMLTGRPPFNGPTPMATALSHLRDPPPHVASVRPEISAGLDAFVDQLLAKSPADRPPTAPAVRRTLDGLVREGLLAGAGPRSTSPAAVVDGAVAAAGAAGGAAAGGAAAGGAAGRAAGAGAAGVGVDQRRPPAVSGSVGTTAWPPVSAPQLSAPPVSAPQPSVVLPVGSPVRSGGAPARGAEVPKPAPPGAPPAGTSPVVRPSTRPDSRAPNRSRAGRRRRGLFPGLVIAALVLVAVIAAATLIADHGGAGHHSAATGAHPAATATAPAIEAVAVWMNTTAHPPDNPGGTGATFDGKASTAWQTDVYKGPQAAHFGGLYSGEGLAIHLSRSESLTRLEVQSTTQGWAASAYVATAEPAIGSPVSAWGTPTASVQDINGNASFSLGGRAGSWVLLWLTDLGPSAHASIAELAVS